MTNAIDVPKEEVEPAPEVDIDRAKSPGSSYPTEEVPQDETLVEEQRNEVRHTFNRFHDAKIAQITPTDPILALLFLRWNSHKP